MRRVVLTLSLAIALVMAYSLRPEQRVHGQVQALTVAPITPDAVRQWDAEMNRMLRTNELQVRLEREDTLLPGRVIQQLDQYYRGVRIWGSGASRQLLGQSAISVFGVLYTIPDIHVIPRISQTEAKAIIESIGKVELGPERQPELTIVVEEGGARLAWIGAFVGESESAELFIDANTGEVFRRGSAFHTQLPSTSPVGHGKGVLGDDKKISTSAVGGAFVAFDTLRPPEISTFNMRGAALRAFFIFNGLLTPLTSDFASAPSTNEWTDAAAVDAHVYSSLTYDYYFKRFGRRGLDNADRRIWNLTHLVRRTDVGLAPDEFFINAAYHLDSGLMYYGEGIDFAVDLGQGLQRINYLAGALDIVAHELTHGVTQNTSKLVYLNESGALNESFSDIMGTSVEFSFQPVGTGLMRADYLIGEDVFTAVTSGARNGIRSFEDPALYGQPDHYNSPLRVRPVSIPTPANDAGGVLPLT